MYVLDGVYTQSAVTRAKTKLTTDIRAHTLTRIMFAVSNHTLALT